MRRPVRISSAAIGAAMVPAPSAVTTRKRPSIRYH
jgi:hypothetical protein